MTEIAERIVHGAQMHDHEGDTIHPGTLCNVRSGIHGPPGFYGQTVLAVYTGASTHVPWLLLLSVKDAGDDVGRWLRGSLSDAQIEQFHLAPFLDTHRGWWANRDAVTFVERATPKTEHAVGDDPSVVSGLRTQLSEAREREAAAVKALEDFKAKVIEIGGEAAEEHEWCSVYEDVMGRLGLDASEHYEVEVEITLRTKVTTYARSPAIAAQRVAEADWPTPDLEIESDYEMSFSSPEKTVRLINS